MRFRTVEMQLVLPYRVLVFLLYTYRVTPIFTPTDTDL